LKEQHHKKKKRSATDKLWDSIDLLWINNDWCTKYTYCNNSLA